MTLNPDRDDELLREVDSTLEAVAARNRWVDEALGVAALDDTADLDKVLAHFAAEEGTSPAELLSDHAQRVEAFLRAKDLWPHECGTIERSRLRALDADVQLAVLRRLWLLAGTLGARPCDVRSAITFDSERSTQ